MALDFTQDSSRKGYIGWNAFTQSYGSVSRPAVEIELFIKEHSMPTRRRKYTEMATVNRQEPQSKADLGFAILVEGAPDILTVTISGFTKTPISGGYYAPKDKTGAALTACAGLTYVEIITDYLNGRMNIGQGRSGRRRDPDYFISPYGHKYTNPIFMTWEPSATANFAKKQTFSATLLLEK